jgi:hypothetical protein
MKKKVFQQPTTKIVELGVCSMIAASTPPSRIDDEGIQATHADYGSNAWEGVAWN